MVTATSSAAAFPLHRAVSGCGVFFKVLQILFVLRWYSCLLVTMGERNIETRKLTSWQVLKFHPKEGLAVPLVCQTATAGHLKRNVLPRKSPTMSGACSVVEWLA